MGFSFLQGIIVARVLGAEKYGTLALITTFATTVNQFVDSRVWEAAIKYIVQFREAGEHRRATAMLKFCYLIDTITATVAFIIVLALADWGARVFVKDPTATDLIRLYALAVVFAIPTGTSSALLRVDDRFDWIAYTEAGMAGAKLVGVILALVLFNAGIIGLLTVYLMTTAIGAVVLTLLGRKVAQRLEFTSWRDAPLRLLKGQYRQIFKFLAATNGNALFKLLQKNADTLLIGYLLGPTDVGYYKVAQSITRIMSFPINPLYTTSYPEFTRLWHRNLTGALRKLVRRLTMSSVAFATLAGLFFWAGAEWIIHLSVGDDYLPAVSVLRWLAAATAIAIATNFAHPLLLAVDKVTRSLLAITIGVIVQLAVLILLIPQIGIAGAGVAYLFFYIAWTIIIVLSLRAVWRQSENEFVLG